VAAVTEVIGDVRSKVALIGDDMIVPGTIIAATEALTRPRHTSGARPTAGRSAAETAAISPGTHPFRRFAVTRRG
jgi:hypothetical protein